MTFKDSIAPLAHLLTMASDVQRVRVCSLCRDAVDHSPFSVEKISNQGWKETYF